MIVYYTNFLFKVGGEVKVSFLLISGGVAGGAVSSDYEVDGVDRVVGGEDFDFRERGVVDVRDKAAGGAEEVGVVVLGVVPSRAVAASDFNTFNDSR